MLIGKKVILEDIHPVNVEWLRQQRNRPELRKYFREWKDISIDKQKDWYNERGNNTNPNHVYWSIYKNFARSRGYEPNNAHLIGCCGLHYIDWRLRTAEFGIFITPEEQGEGFGGEALRLMFDFGFKEMNLHKIWAEVFDNNEALKIYTDKIGMKIDGTVRHTYFSDGEYGNSFMLSVLDNEWKELRKGK